VLSFYKKLVMGDESMLAVNAMPTRRLGANEAAKSVKWMGSGEQWAWMRDLYRIIYGFGVDDTERKGGSVQIRESPNAQLPRRCRSAGCQTRLARLAFWS
jgi:hypothetical protein